ncbi:hypothetical protein NPIL_78051 [Nephila pilipes]|uniref:Uncharacterized protein n=1 Tax=Nephila pilipes TaxID=299642 RepID=A0A8X6INB5_NEPPI|nr:hypothetical protein NPIL_78051 [Nephila pilipes]
MNLICPIIKVVKENISLLNSSIVFIGLKNPFFNKINFFDVNQLSAMSLNSHLVLLEILNILIVTTSMSVSQQGGTGNRFSMNGIPIYYPPLRSWPPWDHWNPVNWHAGHQSQLNTDSIRTLPVNQDFRISSKINSSPGVPGSRNSNVLSTLFNGMKNTGLEERLVGEILQRIFKTALKDIFVPFKNELFT